MPTSPPNSTAVRRNAGAESVGDQVDQLALAVRRLQQLGTAAFLFVVAFIAAFLLAFFII